MVNIGARELKNRLGHYLRLVSHGETIIVTLRGKPIARLTPVSPEGDVSPLPAAVADQLWLLVAAGKITWGGQNFQLPEAVAHNKSSLLLSDLVIEDRT